MADKSILIRKGYKPENRTGQTIQYDPYALEREQEELRRLELEDYVPALPARTCPGMAEARLEALGQTLIDLYDQVQLLIAASNKMLETMGRGIEQADRCAAKYSG